MGTGSTTTEHASTAEEAIQWFPIDLLRRTEAEARGPGFALIVLNQPITPYLGIIRGLWKNAFTHIAADGGANCLYEAAGIRNDPIFDNLSVIIGDLDSLTSEARAYFESTPHSPPTRVIHDPDQESTDFGKAVDHVRAQNHHHAPLDIVAVGGLGGRVDQGLSQLHHLYLYQSDPRYAAGRMYLFSGESLTFLLKTGRHRIHVREPAGQDDDDVFAKYVGILPVREPSVITTRGLEWDVTAWETAFGGRMSTSNHVLPGTRVVEVETTRDVLFTIALRQV
ncbi:thiamine pyrophosphokinase [Schizothecium vesticola]|uniref:Thiamine pyrophosphokinase n=1 Tax=Schizothecium vesticola TaxID=314040 RepID=A0AA40EWY2_9PEZI|nr:thiamine pyrophosphokinase [Schizothecium vesticola]